MKIQSYLSLLCFQFILSHAWTCSKPSYAPRSFAVVKRTIGSTFNWATGTQTTFGSRIKQSASMLTLAFDDEATLSDGDDSDTLVGSEHDDSSYEGHKKDAVTNLVAAEKQLSSSEIDDLAVAKFESEDAKKKAVGNLVADNEWLGISMELSEVVRLAVIEDLKKNARDFLGKDNYKIGDISKELDARVKEKVADLRGKDEYELGDFVMAMDEASKKMTEELTGKPYETGDLSKELDKRIKSAVAKYAGKDEYQPGDLTKTVASRVMERVEEFTGKPYEFGDITRAIEERRQQWVKDFLGEEAAANYQFGDLTKKAIAKFTGKEEYQFGDISKKIFGDLFGKRKKGGSDGTGTTGS
ncbi:hypothetical protein ACA910_005233 [Epithemia clementina (nom. ined.)]